MPDHRIVSPPRVSVVMPYLKAASTVMRAVLSLQRQTIADFELIAVDDGSTDGTEALIARAAETDPRIRTIAYGANRGPSYARNRAIDAARGEWIAVLDADDWYAPNRLETLLAAAGQAPVVADGLMGIDPEDGTEVGALYPAMPASIGVGDIARLDVPGSKFDYGYLKPMYRRAFVETHRLRYREDLRTAEDMLFLLECAILGGRIRTVAAPLYHYNLQVSPKRKRPARTSHTSPRVRDFGNALRELAARRGAMLTTDEAVAIDARVTGLLAGADVLEFRHAFYTGHYRAATRAVLTSPRVRHYVVDAVLRKARLRPSNAP